MATIGLDKLYYATITDDENGEEIYGTQKQSQQSYLLNWQRQRSMQMMVRQKSLKNLKMALSLLE